jgi:hypothetical protein
MPDEAADIPGQMTIDDCIEVARRGLDGKPSIPSSPAGDRRTGARPVPSRAGRPPKRPMSPAEVVDRMLKDRP